MTKFTLPSLTDDVLGSSEGQDDQQQTASHQCVGCGGWSPVGHGEHTLISSTYGWRLSRKPDGRGGHAYEWRCPVCWKRHKDKEAAR